MTPERWQRVEDLYHAASARLPGDRASFLAEACPDDEEIRREVQSLLNEPPSDDGFLAKPALTIPPHLLPDLTGAGMTGHTLGGYHLQALIGAGGMGEVYRAKDARLGRDVAIKILPRGFTSDPDRLARFEREARMLGALNHPNICAIYGFEEADAVRFLILELVEGKTLAETLRSHPKGTGLPLHDATDIARQIADALEAAHERGIIHRDLKPANIKITADGVVKVLDFGLAKPVSADASTPELTQAPGPGGERAHGAVLGTAAYMSPEQTRGLAVDKRTDIWAFGCVLYEMVTGHVTFAGDTVSDSIAKILERDPDWSLLPPNTPPSIRRALLRCLAKNPKERLRDIADVRMELAALDERPLPPHDRSAGRSRLKDVLPWLALAASIIAIALWILPRPIVNEAPAAVQLPSNPLENAQFLPFTEWDGTEAGAEISPDGRFVVFASDRDGEFDLWLSQVGTGRFANLTKEIPALSPPGVILRSFGFNGDGSEIWFSNGGDPGAAKMLVPLTGGAPRPFLNEGAATPSWSPDDTHIVYETITVNSGDPLFIADRTGGDARQIFVHPDGKMHNHNPVWSPDGEWIYFTQGPEASTDMDIWRLKATGGSPERLTTQNIAINFLAPIDARTLLYVARDKDRSGPWLWSLDVERKVTRRVVSGLDQFTSVSASRDGRRVVATVADFTSSLWRVPLLPWIADEADAEPYPLPAGRALAPRFAGSALFYLSPRGSAAGLWRVQDGQPSEVRLGADGALSEPPAVSADGSRVALVLRRGGKRQLAVMSADGTGSQTLSPAIDIRGAAAQGAADWSPDGRWIVTGGADAAGPALFKIPIDGGTPVRLVEGDAVNPVWSPDGRLIVYAGPLSAGQVTLSAVRPDGTRVEFPALRVRQGGYRFSPTGAELIYLPTITSLDFWGVDLRTNQRRQRTRLAARGTLHTFDVTPDGKAIVFDRARENSDIVLIELPK